MKCEDCRLCELRDSAAQVITGKNYGDKVSVFLLGESPGQEEDLVGEPFADRGGDILKKCIEEAKLTNYRMTYLVKCWPRKRLQSGHIDTCMYWLQAELKQYQPKVIVTLGKLPLQKLFKLPANIKLEEYIGESYELQLGECESLVYPWYHTMSFAQRGRKFRDQTTSFLQKVRSRAGGL